MNSENIAEKYTKYCNKYCNSLVSLVKDWLAKGQRSVMSTSEEVLLLSRRKLSTQHYILLCATLYILTNHICTLQFVIKSY